MGPANTPDLSARLSDARSLPVLEGHLSTPVLRHGTMELRIYRPGPGDDEQTPHDRDELYIVAAGSAVLLRGVTHSPWEEPSPLEDALQRVPLSMGDAVAVPAGTVHRFVEISADFATWMVFWGPEGGESA